MPPLLRRLAPPVLVLALLLGAAAAWQLFAPEAIDPDDPVQVARGEVIYRQHCASCHGARLEGEPDWRIRRPSGELPAPPHDASGHTWHHGDAQLFAMVKEGIAAFAPPGYKTAMPAFGAVLSDADIRAVLAYIKSNWPEDIRRRQEAIQPR